MTRVRFRRRTRFLSLNDYAPAARRLLPRALYAYLTSSAGEGRSLEENNAAFRRWSLMPRVLRGVAGRDTGVTLLGHRYAAPIGVAPFGAAAVIGFDADRAMARAARRANVPYLLSANSITPMEAVIAENPNAWFAAYFPSDRSVIEAMLARIGAAGFKVLVITVDVPVANPREGERRAHYTMPLRGTPRLALDMATHPRWLLGRFARTLAARGVPRISNITATPGPSIFSRRHGTVGGAEAFDWDTIREIRRGWSGRLVLKGVLSPEDATLARACGVDGLVVSNHGARMIDSVVAPIQAIAAIRAACPDMMLLLDSGIRRSADIYKAMALGADAVLIGRPFFFSAILGGEAGLGEALSLIRAEFDRDMAYLGLRTCAEIGRHILVDRFAPGGQDPSNAVR
jgi:L-lactate dehydrogenase (cytochrome)